MPFTIAVMYSSIQKLTFSNLLPQAASIVLQTEVDHGQIDRWQCNSVRAKPAAMALLLPTICVVKDKLALWFGPHTWGPVVLLLGWHPWCDGFTIANWRTMYGELLLVHTRVWAKWCFSTDYKLLKLRKIVLKKGNQWQQLDWSIRSHQITGSEVTRWPLTLDDF